MALFSSHFLHQLCKTCAVPTIAALKGQLVLSQSTAKGVARWRFSVLSARSLGVTRYAEYNIPHAVTHGRTIDSPTTWCLVGAAC